MEPMAATTQFIHDHMFQMVHQDVDAKHTKIIIDFFLDGKKTYRFLIRISAQIYGQAEAYREHY